MHKQEEISMDELKKAVISVLPNSTIGERRICVTMVQKALREQGIYADNNEILLALTAILKETTLLTLYLTSPTTEMLTPTDFQLTFVP